MFSKHGSKEEGMVLNQQKAHGQRRLIDARGKRSMACVVQSNRRAAKAAEEVNAGSNRSDRLLCMGLHCCRPVRVIRLTRVHSWKHQQWACEHQNWTMEQQKKVAWFFYITWMDRRYQGEHISTGCIMRRRQAGRGCVMLWALFRWETLGPAIHLDVTLICTTHLSTVAGHVHPFMETAFHDACGLFR